MTQTEECTKQDKDTQDAHLKQVLNLRYTALHPVHLTKNQQEIYMFNLLKRLIIFYFLLFLMGCGQGGPLYLPPAKEVHTTSKAQDFNI
jgi:predicted small lipoprotein YifL